MYKAVIIEDEYHLREALSLLLEMVVPEQIQITGYAEGLPDAVTLIDRLKPDVVFMDVKLKNGTGFEVLNNISYKDFHLIFTTAYEEYAVRAFKFNAIDYLLKPIDPEELKNTIERIEKNRRKYVHFDALMPLSEESGNAPERIVLPTQEAMHVVKLKSIIRCETSGSYTTFFLENDKKIMVSKPLKHYEEMLGPPYFMRVHQSHLINVDYIASYSKDGMITLKDKSTVPVSRANRESFFRMLKNEQE